MIKKKCKDCGTLEAITFNSDCPTCDSDSGWWLTCDQHQEVIFRSEVTECPICVAQARGGSGKGEDSSRFDYNCSNCGQKLEIPKELAGHNIECPNCTAKLVVPRDKDSDQDGTPSKFVYCTNCGEDLEIPEDSTDQELECPSCGIELEIARKEGVSRAVGVSKNITPPVNITTPMVKLPSFKKPENFLIMAIVTTLCCCMPLGIASIVYASQVDSKFNAGDYQGAINASNNAKMWAWIAFGIGLAVNLLVILAEITAE